MDYAGFAVLDRDELPALVVALRTQVVALQDEVESLKRSGKRKAAPFSQGTRAAKPKRPGRKSGQKA